MKYQNYQISLRLPHHRHDRDCQNLGTIRLHLVRVKHAQSIFYVISPSLGML